MLYRMPTDAETQDNIAAFWVSDEPAKAGGSREYAYRLTWTSQALNNVRQASLSRNVLKPPSSVRRLHIGLNLQQRMSTMVSALPI